MCWAGVSEGKVVPAVWVQPGTVVNGERLNKTPWKQCPQPLENCDNSARLLVSTRLCTVPSTPCDFGILEAQSWLKSYNQASHFSYVISAQRDLSPAEYLLWNSSQNLHLIRSHQASQRLEGGGVHWCIAFFISGACFGRSLSNSTSINSSWVETISLKSLNQFYFLRNLIFLQKNYLNSCIQVLLNSTQVLTLKCSYSYMYISAKLFWYNKNYSSTANRQYRLVRILWTGSGCHTFPENVGFKNSSSEAWNIV